MGIKGLRAALKECQLIDGHIKDWSGKKVVVDGFAWLHKVQIVVITPTLSQALQPQLERPGPAQYLYIRPALSSDHSVAQGAYSCAVALCTDGEDSTDAFRKYLLLFHATAMLVSLIAIMHVVRLWLKIARSRTLPCPPHR